MGSKLRIPPPPRAHACSLLPLFAIHQGKKKRKTSMKTSAAAAIFLSVAIIPAIVTDAARNRLKVSEGDINFKIFSFDDGRSRPYQINFWTSDTGSSRFKFDQAGRVTYIKASSEKYVVRYKSNGSLRRLVRKDSGARTLLLSYADEAGYEHHLEGDAIVHENRRLYACDDCEYTWDTICGDGIPSVCDLVGHASLGATGTFAVDIVCEMLGSVCNDTSADTACDGQCIDGE